MKKLQTALASIFVVPGLIILALAVILILVILWPIVPIVALFEE